MPGQALSASAGPEQGAAIQAQHTAVNSNATPRVILLGTAAQAQHTAVNSKERIMRSRRVQPRRQTLQPIATQRT